MAQRLTTQRRVRESLLRQRRLLLEQLEDRRLLAVEIPSAWQLPYPRMDVNQDRAVTPLDALQIINVLNRSSRQELGPATNAAPPDARYDTSRDGQLTPLDALLVINVISRDRQPPTIAAEALTDRVAEISTNVGFVLGTPSGSIFSGTVSDDWTGIQTLVAHVDGGTPIQVPISDDGRFAFDPGLPTDGSADGEHHLQFVATDGRGQSRTLDRSFMLDTLGLPAAGERGAADSLTTSDALGSLAAEAENQPQQMIRPQTESFNAVNVSGLFQLVQFSGYSHHSGPNGHHHPDVFPVLAVFQNRSTKPIPRPFFQIIRLDGPSCGAAGCKAVDGPAPIDPHINNDKVAGSQVLGTGKVRSDILPSTAEGVADATPDVVLPGEKLVLNIGIDINLHPPERFFFNVNIVNLPECTLRAAITESNATAGKDTIVFNASGRLSVNSKEDHKDAKPGDKVCSTGNFILPGDRSGVWSIPVGTSPTAPGLPLPTVTDPVSIDGATQPGFAGAPIVEVNRQNTTVPASENIGLGITAGQSTVKGLVVNGFTTGIQLTAKGNNQLLGNYIGTDVSGLHSRPNFYGVSVHGSPDNMIGGAGTAARNVISGNTGPGIAIAYANSVDNRIQGNYIGVDSSGATALSNRHGGVEIDLGANRNIIGTDGNGMVDDSEGNVISGNRLDGVRISGPAADHNVVAGNLIGVDIAGVKIVPNHGSGVLINGGAQNNRVGTDGNGTSDALERNVISGNLLDGVRFGHSLEFAAGDPADDFDITINAPGLTPDQQALINAAVARITQIIVKDIPAAVAFDGTKIDDFLLDVRYKAIDGPGNTLAQAAPTELRPGSFLPLRGIVEIDTADVAAPPPPQTVNTIVHEIVHALGFGTIWRHLGLLSNAGTADPQYTGSGGVSEFAALTMRPETSIPVQGVAAGPDSADSHWDENVFEHELMTPFLAGKAAPPEPFSRMSVGSMIDLGYQVNLAKADPYMLAAIPAAGGVVALPTSRNKVSGNLIGTDKTGGVALGNTATGVRILGDSAGNLIGTDGDNVGDAAEGNLISGNGLDGVTLSGAGATQNIVAGNLVGTDKAGMGDLGNARSGVRIENKASQNFVGRNGPRTTSDKFERNVISGNGGDGVTITGFGSNQNQVAGNLIGTDISGQQQVANDLAGVRIENGAQGNVIGHDFLGSNEDTRNYISGNTGNGVLISGAATIANHVAGNFIGTNKSGTAQLAGGKSNGGDGVRIELGATANIIGFDGVGDELEERNIISGNTKHGVSISGAGTNQNRIANNYIGTVALGFTELPNGGSGVHIDGGAQQNVIGTNGDGVRDAVEGNVISGNGADGVTIQGQGTDRNKVAGNRIGIGTTPGVIDVFSARVPNLGSGVRIDKAAQLNTIGTDGNDISDALEQNVISGNKKDGVTITGPGTDFNEVAGNLIGTDRGGRARRPNVQSGVRIEMGAQANVIGSNGINPVAQKNVISGNDADGVTLDGVSKNTVAANFIGVDHNGNFAVRNLGSGVQLLNKADNNLIGLQGKQPRDQGNVISGNQKDGVLIAGGSTMNQVSGNRIGVSANELFPIGNEENGVKIDASSNNLIGTKNEIFAERNHISGNQENGVYILAGSNGNQVSGNLIGTDLSRTRRLGNGKNGVLIEDSSVTIVGTKNIAFGPPLVLPERGNLNVIAFNGANGVAVVRNLAGPGAAQNQIAANDIFRNQGLGIDLDPTTGVGNDPIFGPNAGIQAPELLSVDFKGATPTVTIALENAAVVDFYVSRTPDPSGSGEGERWFARELVNVVGTATLKLPPVPAGYGRFITATATEAAAGGPPHNTSEFSNAVTEPATITSPGVVNSTGDKGDQNPGDGICSTGGVVVRSLGFLELECTLRAFIEEANATGPIDGFLEGVNDVAGPFTELTSSAFTGDLTGQTLMVTSGAAAAESQIILEHSGTTVLVADFENAPSVGDTYHIAVATYIAFDIPVNDPGYNPATEVFSIRPSTALPTVIQPVIIDGYTQPGARPNTEATELATDAALRIELRGSNVAGDGLYGDVNSDDVLDNADLDQIVDWLLGRDPLPAPDTLEFALADLNADEAITLSDLNLLVDMLLGRIEKFPVGVVHGAEGLHITAGNSVVRGLVINQFAGSAIRLSDGGGNAIEGNFLGTELRGSAGLPNLNGIQVLDSDGNVIGGLVPAARNLISGNAFEGVYLYGEDATGNAVQGNLIGTRASGTVAIPNLRGGAVIDRASGNTVGGVDPPAANAIAFNGSATAPSPTGGVLVAFGRQNAILGNAIFENVGLGIDLNVDGVTPNDPLDVDAGANDTQNFPMLTSAIQNGQLVVTGTLHSAPNTLYRVEFFASDSADPSGQGEGRTIVHAIEVLTDAAGVATFEALVSPLLTLGQVVTATATDPDGNTSEFSHGVTVTMAVP